MEETRSSVRRSIGRGTAVDREIIVDSNAGSVNPSFGGPDFLRISDPNIALVASNGAQSLQNGTLGTMRLKERFLP